ncbi:SDR family NAD(P)-dependent oxidoreductase [Reinekea sp.]|jgi:dehydrogenase/reductase SDR family protein 7B|uniref:SDR family NAD(P)-dependent oxidoreductase n=1 Tax=Reinekea sp. TaxID=1970455 RepID=UPI003989737E
MPSVNKNTDNHVAVVTGAAAGLGWALVQRLLQDSWQVLLIDRDEQLLHSRLEECEQSRANIHILAVDLLEPDAIFKVKSAVANTFGTINLLINNAGITHRSLIDITDTEVFKRVMDLDYRVPVELTLALKPLICEKQPGQQSGVINIGSMAGWMPVVGRAGYCAAKSALSQFFETYRAEQLSTDPHILMVYPSFLATDIEKNALGHDGKQAQHQRTSVGHITSAESMADLIIIAFTLQKPRLFPDKFTAASAMLYRLSPSFFMKLMKNKFSDELSNGRAQITLMNGAKHD